MSEQPAIPPTAPTREQRDELEQAYQRYCAHSPRVGAYIANQRFKTAMEALAFYRMMYNKATDERAANYEKWWRLGDCWPGLTGVQPECDTCMDQTMRHYAKVKDLLRRLARSVGQLASEVVYQSPDDAHDLTEYLEEADRLIGPKGTTDA